MGHKFLLGIGATMVVAAIALGVVGANRATWSGGALGFGMTSGGAARGGMMGGNGPGGMMGGNGPGGMMGGNGPGGMIGGYSTSVPAGTQTISIDQAQKAVKQYVAAYGGSNLIVDELIEFQDNFYGIVKEKSTGTGAFEVLVDRFTGAVRPEPGPNMMWNTKYGMMAGGMMGFARPSGAMTITAERAGQIAQGWLDANRTGAKIEQPDTFYGYYTVHFTQDSQVAGMLSVNGSTGQIWYHTWHGSFIQEKQVDS